MNDAINSPLFGDILAVLQNPEHPQHREMKAISEGMMPGDYQATRELLAAFERRGDSFADWHEYVKSHPPSSLVIGMLILAAIDNHQSKLGRVAANALHSKSGGSRDKAEKMRQLWASGKYESRDICAEQESAALGMSFSAARKALRNTLNPI